MTAMLHDAPTGEFRIPADVCHPATGRYNVKLRLQPECRGSTIAEHSHIFAPTSSRSSAGEISPPLRSPIASRSPMIAVLTGFFGTWCYEKRDLIASRPDARHRAGSR
jgi:hypothetical protein